VAEVIAGGESGPVIEDGGPFGADALGAGGGSVARGDEGDGTAGGDGGGGDALGDWSINFAMGDRNNGPAPGGGDRAVPGGTELAAWGDKGGAPGGTKGATGGGLWTGTTLAGAAPGSAEDDATAGMDEDGPAVTGASDDALVIF
jgi:hypothetical protein